MTAFRSRPAPEPPWRVRAWPSWARAAAAMLVASSRVAPPAVAAAWAIGANFEPQHAFAVLVALGLLPDLALRLLARAFAARVAIESDRLCLVREGIRVEVPLASLAAVRPWRIPLPGAGVSLRLRSGAPLPGVEPTPRALLAGLERAGVLAPTHPNLAYGMAREERARRLWEHPLVKFGVFGAFPMLVLFRAHQIIAYGGLLGQYYLEGLRPYLATALEYGGITLLYLLILASVARLLGELAAYAATRLAPARAGRIRAVTEAGCAAAYYAGVPALLAIRFLA